MKVLLIFFLLIVASLSCVYPGRHMMDWGHMDYGYGGVFMWIILLVLVGVIIYFVVKGQKSTTEGGEDTPLEILKKRYAKGEIIKKEFDKMKKDLMD